MGIRSNAAVRLLAASLMMAAVAGCGGGGGGDAGDGLTPAPPPVSPPPGPPLLQFGVDPSASVVLGQETFEENGADEQGRLDRMNSPAGDPGVTGNGELIVADRGSNRLMVFGDYQGANGQTATFVLPTTFPSGVALHGQKLVVLDATNSVSIYNTAPTASGASTNPDVVGTGVAGCTDRDMRSPRGAYLVAPAGPLIIADGGNHRVLIWHSIPESGELGPANVVVGQMLKNTCTSNDHDADGTVDDQPSASTLNTPAAVWSDGKRLIVADEGNNRVLIWKNLPTTDFQPADFVVGQLTFTGQFSSAPSRESLACPASVDVSEAGQLAVADQCNDRILIWDRIPEADFQPANQVIGQSDFNRNDRGGFGTEGKSLNLPSGVHFHGRNLIVVDTGNHRVLVWKAQE